METATPVGDAQLVRALREGDEAAFAALAREHHGSLLRVAQISVSSRAVAEEVVQETWLVLNALGVSETNQRVLLHRARSKVRRALEAYLAEAQ